MAAPSMNAIADRFASDGIGGVFIYTNEAHPAENYPHHTSLEVKFQHARALRDQLGVTRPILVDSLDGACHRGYGGMPNMSWVFSRNGIPVYKADWTDSHSIELAVEYYLKILQKRRQGLRITPFQVERIDYRQQDMEAFFKGLERNGPKAVREFREFDSRMG